MSRLFISHSSVNDAEAVAIRDWLQDNGWDDIYLDLDPERGSVAGERWEKSLNEAARHCEAVIFLISRAWLNSDWCDRELNLAIKLNKRLFGVLIEDLTLKDIPQRIAATWQIVYLASGSDHIPFDVTLPITGAKAYVTFSAEGLKRLRLGLIRAGLDPRFFDWPPETEPDRPPYPGLKPLQAEDAGIFFGREAEIIEALDRLRGLNESPSPRLLVILGASGGGKSSFMRAGLWPRLQRDYLNFLPLPVMRPKRAALWGDAGLLCSLDSAFKAVNAPRARADIRKAVEGGTDTLTPVLADLAKQAMPPALGSTSPKAPTLVLPIDQGEELFLSEGAEEARVFLSILRNTLIAAAPACLALITIRSDAFERLQTAASLASVPQHTLSLPPIAKGAYAEIIEGPAGRLADTPRALKIEPALTRALLDDIGSGDGKDALPLLAFTLERLYVEYGATGNITLSNYDALGRVKGSIEAAVEGALAAAEANPAVPRDRSTKLALLRRGLIPWLAGVDPDTGTPRRRVAKQAEIPGEARPLIDALVEARLLSTDTNQAGKTTIEPSHEALLRQWGDLERWLKEDLGTLTILEGVKRAENDWAANGKGAVWLSHRGGRLEEAEKQAARVEFANYLNVDDRAYLAACRALENAEASRKRRTSELITYGSLSSAVVLLLLAMAAWQERKQAQFQAVKATQASARIFAERSWSATADGNKNLALRYALAGYDLAPSNAKFYRAALATALVPPKNVSKTSSKEHSGAITSLAVRPDGLVLVSGGEDGLAIVWSLPALVKKFILPHDKSPVDAVSFDASAQKILTVSRDGIIRMWSADKGQLISELRGHSDFVTAATFSPDGRRIVTASADKTTRLWDAITGQELAVLRHEAEVYSARFSPDGSRVLTASADHTARVWDAASGMPIGTALLHQGAVTASAFSADGRFVLTASQETMFLWDLPTGRLIRAFSGHDALIRAISVAPDSSRAYVLDNEGGGYVWDLKGELIIATPKKFAGNLAEFSPDGEFAILASESGEFLLWDVQAAHDLVQLSGPSVKSTAIIWTENGLISGNESGTIAAYKNASLFASIEQQKAAACSMLEPADRKFTRREAAVEPLIREIWDALGTARDVCEKLGPS